MNPSGFAMLLTLAVSTLFAQTQVGRISGTVSDVSAASIAGAKVLITNTDTQPKRILTTDDRGFYVAESLAIGPYSVAVDHRGVKTGGTKRFYDCGGRSRDCGFRFAGG